MKLRPWTRTNVDGLDLYALLEMRGLRAVADLVREHLRLAKRVHESRTARARSTWKHKVSFPVPTERVICEGSAVVRRATAAVIFVARTSFSTRSPKCKTRTDDHERELHALLDLVARAPACERHLDEFQTSTKVQQLPDSSRAAW